jgi:hypothetical protein
MEKSQKKYSQGKFGANLSTQQKNLTLIRRVRLEATNKKILAPKRKKMP